MIYRIRRSAKFKKGVKRMVKRGVDMSLIDKAVEVLQAGGED